LYDTNSEWKSFKPANTDVLIAEVDFEKDSCSVITEKSYYHGIRKGVLNSDMECRANDRFPNAGTGTNPGEFYVQGTFFTYTTKYEVDYGNGNGWVPATTLLTNNLDYSSDRHGSYKWREVSSKLNNKALIAFVPDAQLKISVGETMKVRCRDTCEVYFIWMEKIALCSSSDTESTCRPKLQTAVKRSNGFDSLLTDWKDEGVDTVAQQYHSTFTNYDLTKNSVGRAHGFYLINMAAKSKVLHSEEITVGPATSEGRFFVAFIEK
jgi:hypothetical protein